jgi:transcriptional regulator with XRE-family HTH domain
LSRRSTYGVPASRSISTRLNVATLGRYERGETNAQIDTLDAILRALRAHGIHFLEETDTISMGVVLMKNPRESGRDVGDLRHHR